MKAFLKKEWMENVRSGRLLLLLLIFLLFGIMNPAFAKLTPWMMNVMSDSLEDAGFLVGEVTVDAMTSWAQFYKNIPMTLLIFVLLNSGTFTVEYQKETLIPVVTRGLSRSRILAAKTVMLAGLWTVGYFLCYGTTLGYNWYFWDNRIAAHCGLGAVYYWFFGLWVISWMIFFSTVCQSSIQVLAGTGAVVFGVYLLGMVPKLHFWLPSELMNGLKLLQGLSEPKDYGFCLIVTGITAAAALLLSRICFERRTL